MRGRGFVYKVINITMKHCVIKLWCHFFMNSFIHMCLFVLYWTGTVNYFYLIVTYIWIMKCVWNSFWHSMTSKIGTRYSSGYTQRHIWFETRCQKRLHWFICFLVLRMMLQTNIWVSLIPKVFGISPKISTVRFWWYLIGYFSWIINCAVRNSSVTCAVKANSKIR